MVAADDGHCGQSLPFPGNTPVTAVGVGVDNDNDDNRIQRHNSTFF